MGLFKEFREFVMRGNVVDLAVGVIIGAAFGKIVSSMVSDILMPPIGLATNGIDFSKLHVTLKAGDGAVDPATGLHAGEVAIRYGMFINNTIDFLIVAACVFFVVKAVNSLKRSTPPPPAAPNKSEVLLTEIRDALRAR